MKKNWKSVLAGGAAVTVLAGVLAIPALAYAGSRTARLDYQNMKVTLDGQTLTLTDGSGNTVEPFTIDGTTYLPLASISTALGMDVRWDADTNTVILNTKGTGTTAAESYIGVERAKEIALKDAGLSASQVSFVRAGLDWDNGRMEYEVEFWKDNVEYDYEIDAATGSVVSYDYDAENYVSAKGATTVSVDEATAKQTVLNKVPGATAANIYEWKLDFDDGHWEYDGKIVYNLMEYDFTVDASSGAVTEWGVESIFD